MRSTLVSIYHVVCARFQRHKLVKNGATNVATEYIVRPLYICVYITWDGESAPLC